MSSDEARTKRSAKKPAWMTDEMLIDPAEVEAEVRMMMPKPNPRMMAQHVVPAHHHNPYEVQMPRAMRPSGRMCSNPQCKNPFDSPQWRRGPLGPGTLCNACGTRYARLQAKMNGDKRGKMRPQERQEWEAFEQQRLHPQAAAQHQQQQTWRVHMQSFVQREQQQQYYGAQEDDYAGYEESDYGYDERSYGSQQQGGHRREQQHCADAEQDMHDPDEAYQDGLSDSPDIASRAAIAAAVAAAAAAAAAGARPTRPVWRGSRQQFPPADAATDSQEDEAAAYSHQEGPAGMDAAAAAAAAAGSPAGPSFLHLLAVGEAMIKTENVAPQERRAAYTEVVGKGMGPEPERAPAARAAGGEAAQGVKRSRFALEAEEQQGARPSSAAEPTALQRALERFGVPAAAPRAKPAGSEHTGAEGDRFQRLLAEAEACVRARSVSPCMLKGMPGPGGSPITGATPAARPITPLQLGVNAVDAAAGRAGLAGFMLPAAAMPRRPASAGAGAGGRHSSLAQALAAAAAAEVSSPGEEGEGGGMQGSPHSQYDVTASNAGNVGHRGDAARAFDAANIDASYGAAGSSLPHDLHGHMQALLGRMGQMQSTEPSPVSKTLLADEVLSPTTMHMSSGRPRKQTRTVGPQGMMGGAAASSGAGGSLQLQRSGTPGDGAAANTGQSDLLQQQAAHSMMLQQAQGQQEGLTSAPMPGPLPTAAELQQAGHRPVVLACQLVLQQQANPTALRPLFAAPGGSASPSQPRQGSNPPGLGANAELVSSALQLAQAGSGGNTQTQLDHLKAVTMSAQAAAATASAVAAATALLWQQLQQQEQARVRQLEQPEEPGQDLPPAQGQAGGDVGADADVDDAAAGVGEPAPPGSPVADPAAGAQGASGSMSRSSSSSTSAAGLSAAAPGDSHGVDKPAAAPTAATAEQQQAAARTPSGPSPPAEAAAAAAGADVPSAAGVDATQVTSFDHPEQQPAGEQAPGPAADSPATGPGAAEQA